MNKVLIIFLIILSMIILYFTIKKIIYVSIKYKNIKKIYKSFLNNNLNILKVNNEKIIKHNEKVYKLHLINLYKNKRLVVNSKKFIEVFSSKKPLLYRINLENSYTNLIITYGSNSDIKRYINELEMIVCNYNVKYEESYYCLKSNELEIFVKEIINNDL